MIATSQPRPSALREFGAAVATITVKELRSRMRGRRAFIVLTAYLAMLALITYGVYVVVLPDAQTVAGGEFGNFGLGQANASALVGQSIFSVLSIFQIILVSIIAPAFTAGQISLEREKQTLDLLISTPLRPGAIIIGKLLTSLAFVVLLIVAAVPISAIVLMYGGARVEDIVRQQAVLLAAAVVFGTIGIFCSALVKRTQAATVMTYCTVIALTLGTAMIFSFWTAFAERSRDPFSPEPAPSAPEQLRYLNPMVAMLDVVAHVERGGTSRFTVALYDLFGEDLACEQLCQERDEFGNPVRDIADVGGGFGYWWPRFAIGSIGVAAVLTIASMWLVVPAGMRWAFSRRRAASAPFAADGAPRIEELGEEPGP